MNNELIPHGEYKIASLPWLGELPQHWEVKRAKAMYIKVNRSVRDTDEVVTCFRDGTVTLRKNRRTTGFTESIKEIGYQGIRKGDLVIHVMDAFAGAIGVSDSEGKGTPVYSVCIPKEKLNLNNYYYAHVVREMAKTGFIQSLYRGIRERSSDFRFDVFANQYLPIPPIEEQDQIVKYLDIQLVKINKFIKTKKKLIMALKEQKQVVINEAVTKGIIPNVKMKPSGIDWLGDIPEHWDVRYLFQIAMEQSATNKEVHYQNLLSLSYGKIVQKDIKKTDGLLPTTFDTYQIVKNGNIILRLTDLQNDHKSLRVGLVTQTGIITSAYTCLKTRETIVEEYLYLLLHSFDICKVFYGMGSGVRQSMGYADIRKLRVLMPDINEQQEIVYFCYDNINKIDLIIEGIEKEINLITEYRTRLISDVVTGKVDVRDIEVEDIVEEYSDLDESDEEVVDNEEVADFEECEV